MKFRKAWVEKNYSSSILNIFTRLTRHPLIISRYMYPLSPEQTSHRTSAKHKSLVFCSLFLVQKLHPKWRPVIALSRLNQFLRIEKFKKTGEWASSIDLKDAYLSAYCHSPRS